MFSADLGDLAHATVTGLPAETIGPAEIPDAPEAGEVLPQRTGPGPDFGKEVGGTEKACFLLQKQFFLSVACLKALFCYVSLLLFKESSVIWKIFVRKNGLELSFFFSN